MPEATKIGIWVKCTVCGMNKKPHGRSAPYGSFYCAEDCEGYQEKPYPGCLWAGETDVDFGYYCCDHAIVAVTSPPSPTS